MIGYSIMILIWIGIFSLGGVLLYLKARDWRIKSQAAKKSSLD